MVIIYQSIQIVFDFLKFVYEHYETMKEIKTAVRLELRPCRIFDKFCFYVNS